MFFKLARPAARLLARRGPLAMAVRRSGEYLPPTQYDVAIPNKLHLGYAMRVYWEIIPLVFVTCVSCSLAVLYTFWCFVHKVDVVFSARNNAYISRTMDLRNPSVHKIILINQRYEPWPEMQTVLDKMSVAEKRALVRMQTCGHP